MKNTELKQLKKNHHEQILIFMLEKEEWKVSDFTNAWRPHFVSYKAGSRLNELMDDGFVEHHRNEGRFAVYRLTEAGRAYAMALVQRLCQLSEEYYNYIRSVNWWWLSDLKSHVFAKYMTDKMYQEEIEISLSKKNVQKLELIRKAKIYFLVTYYCNVRV